MKENKQYLKQIPKALSSKQNDSANANGFVDNSPRFIFQTKMIDIIRHSNQYGIIQRYFSGDIETAGWTNAIEYIEKESGDSIAAYTKVKQATEEIEVIEKETDTEHTAPEDNSFSVENENKGLIKWNPATNILYGRADEVSAGKISPASALYHEIGHAAQWLDNKNLYNDLSYVTIQNDEDKSEQLLEIHNLANNEIPFNKAKQEPVRKHYYDAKIETDGILKEVTEHTGIQSAVYSENQFIKNYEKMTLEEASKWRVIDNLTKFPSVENLKNIQPLIEKNEDRKQYLIDKLKKIQNNPAPYLTREYKRQFNQETNMLMYQVLTEVERTRGFSIFNTK